MTNLPPHLTAALSDRYRVERELGAGGMATVYLADDLKHHRQVAIKVLKPELAAVVGAERFLAEIQTTANLQHPHILPLFDSGEADGFLYYVMPYVEGESLRDRIDREKQLPVDEAVALGVKVAGALQAAHEMGVIHRDIKPANVLLDRRREPLVADFGIALAVSASERRLTETGLSLGTPHYMSPEQATADRVPDARSDVYSLGCVLYEMLTGEPPFMGTTAQAVIARVLSGNPTPPTEHRRSVPAHVEAAVLTALERVPADRFGTAGEFAVALGDPSYRRHRVGEAGTATSARTRPWVHVAWAAALLAAAFLGPAVLNRPMEPESVGQVQFRVSLGQGAGVFLGGGDLHNGRPSTQALAFSPGGDRIAYVATEPGIGRGGMGLYVHRLDRDGPERIEGVTGAVTPFFSPDGEWLGFADWDGLKRVSLEDGRIEPIAIGTQWTPRRLTGATWSGDGTIVVGTPMGLYRVGATGGVPTLAAKPVPLPGKSARFGPPHLLPDGERVVTHVSGSLDPEDARVVVIDLSSGAETPVLENAMDPRYLPTGHLLFIREGMLMAVGFDPSSARVTSQEMPLVQDVMQSIHMPGSGAEHGTAQISVSQAGHMAYAEGGPYPAWPEQPVRIRPFEEPVPLELPVGNYGRFRVSPDGRHVAFSAGPGQLNRIWIHDLDTGQERVLPTEAIRANDPTWSPEGDRIAFTAVKDSPFESLYVMPADGSEGPRPLVPATGNQVMGSWSSLDVIAYLEGGDIWVLPPDGNARRFFVSEGPEDYPTFSPDGRWLAYRASDGGIYVRPYPEGGPATLIVDHGSEPAWSPDGRTLYFTVLERQALWAVDVTLGDPPRAGRPRAVLDGWTYFSGPMRGYDVFPDGSILTVNWTDARSRLAQFGVTEIRVTLNWLDALSRR